MPTSFHLPVSSNSNYSGQCACPSYATRRDDQPREKCGVIGIWNDPDAVRKTYLGLYAQQHRGQEAAGIAVCDGSTIDSHTGQGLVVDVFKEDVIAKLEASYNTTTEEDLNHGVIGHNRYSTTGGTQSCNAQPLVETTFNGPVAIAHNGNLVNGQEWRKELSRVGRLFHTTSDTEIIVHLLASPEQRDTPDPVAATLRNLLGAFSLVLLFCDRIEAARDPWGWRPLVLGELPSGKPVVASETVALDVMGAKFVREVEPGEIVTLNNDGVTSRRFASPSTELAQCVFEHVYFANPASNVFGQNVQVARETFGAKLAQEAPVDADYVMPMPDSGRSAANGYAIESNIPYREGIVPNRYVGRTFIKPTQEERSAAVRLKLNVISEIVNNKKLIIVDDSIVRGTTTREKMLQLRQAGASEIHLRISCPPIKHPCFFGVDFADRQQLIAHNRTVEQIREYLGVDSLHFLSIKGMLSAMKHEPQHYCTGCFSGKYRVDVDHPVACEVATKAQLDMFNPV
ncbi:MAG: amidophosphoribosyltransferase [Phycisphaerales bacterium]|nr:amidophosphoribosyltransferase [Phycisphaerales bacterium]